MLATTSTFTPADPDLVVIEATGHKAGYADTTVKSKPLSILSPGTLAITLEVDPGTGASGQFAFSNDQDAAAPVEVKLNGVTYASISVPAGTPEDEGTATVPFSDLAPGDMISAWPNLFFATVTYTKPLSWRPTIAQTEAAADAALPITGEGFAPGSEVVLTHSTPIALGTLVVGADGTLSGEVVIPAGVAPGSHTLAFSVRGVMRGQAPITVTAAAGTALAATGIDAGAIAGIAGLLLLAGLTALAGSRRRRASRA